MRWLRYGVRFLTYWFDEARGTGFCLIDAPDIARVIKVGNESPAPSPTITSISARSTIRSLALLSGGFTSIAG